MLYASLDGRNKMKGNLCFLFILLCSCQYFCSCVGEDIHTHKLVLQWPISFCNTGEFQCRNNVPDDDFTIHGLRHFNHNGNILINCGGAPLGRDGVENRYNPWSFFYFLFAFEIRLQDLMISMFSLHKNVDIINKL